MNKIKELTDFYMWMQENDYDHNIRARVERKAEIYLNSINKTRMSEFKQYRRTQIAEMRPVTQHEAENQDAILDSEISVSQADLENGSPKIGDMIARNPKNHKDQWLVAEQYFKDNFEPI